jgi:Exo-beta-D-glucosaminidase Ig-fold domain/Glycosyl hydrolase 2 galactose-binding domain-like/F5/8 type C domain/Glycosyl hydrolases family 2
MKTIRLLIISLLTALSVILISACNRKSDNYTRGVGIYPGDPREDFSPALVADNGTYRNLARLRSAWHSSSYDYNLTAQLVTDGIITSEMPDYISLVTNAGRVPKNEREWLLDNNSVTEMSLDGSDIWLQLEMNHGSRNTKVTRISLNGSFTYDDKKTGGWQFICSGSNDGVSWTELQRSKGFGLPGKERFNPFAGFGNAGQQRRGQGRRRITNPFAGFFGPRDSTAPRPSFTFNFRMPEPARLINQSFEFKQPVAFNFYKISLSATCVKRWTFGDLDLFNDGTRLKITPSNHFTSAWMSAGTAYEWIYVDLGAPSSFDHIKLYWINKAKKGSIQVSDDAKSWKDIVALPGNDELIDDITLKEKVRSRYVRINMNEPSPGNKYILSEMEVFGTGGTLPRQKMSPPPSVNKMYLSGGNWRVQRASEVAVSGEKISESGFNCDDWIVATVPGTVLVSYRNAGALPDPNYNDNQMMISESFFNSDFWYRNEFEIPADFKGECMFLNFDGINWKADIYVNGKKEGRIEGGFIRGKLDVSDIIKPGQKNTIAVLIIKNDNIGVIKEKTAISTDKNGGVLGADNPTYHASIGWDWIPTIRGRNIGIWNDVYLSVAGPVTIEDPFVFTDLPLPDTTAADLNVEVTLRNHRAEAVSGTLSGKYGKIEFSRKVSLGPSESTTVKMNPATDPELHFEKPELWWPKGYGRQNLYDVKFLFKNSDGSISDETAFKSGIRKMTYTEDNDILNIYVNGRRFIGRGGNWGFPESNLEYRGREYDIAVAYHADMNFTMIRNWVGQTGDDEFYEACDRYGIMIWQDFWLANPVDGPNPDDPEMFMNNADDFVKRIRNHPSIGLYCGRNEGNPPEVIDSALRAMLPVLHPGNHYISHSSAGVVSGGGPYSALPPRDYFLLYGNNKFHSERGMPNVMTYESLVKTIPESLLWPQSNLWGIHDYTLEGAQRAATFNEMIEKGFGKPKDAKEFTALAQWINYNGYRGIFEGRSTYRQGMLLWMSHPCWPSMVWQTYDYYFEPTAAYFGCKKGSEPVHIQWNPIWDFRNCDSVEVVNYNGKDRKGLIAKAQVINMDGSLMWEKEAVVDCKEDQTVKCFRLEFPAGLSSVHFIKLTLKQGSRIISDNFYWRGLEYGNYRELRNMPKTRLETTTKVQRSGDDWLLTTSLRNTTSTPALMVRLKVIGNKSGERILPVFFSDNYVSLMPGEEKTITMKLYNSDTRGEKPEVEISGFNL